MPVFAYEITDGSLTVHLAGHIDSTNATAAGENLEKLLAAEPHDHLVLECSALEYLSSAGLRVLLRLIRRSREIRMTEVTPQVYEVLEMTGFTEMVPVSKAMRQFSVEGCPVIGRGAKGTVYRYNPDTIVKVYRDPESLDAIRKERELARYAFVSGVPTAISYDAVRVGDKYGSVFELLDSRSVSEFIAAEPDRIQEMAVICAKLLRTVHDTRTDPKKVPAYAPRAEKWLTAAAQALEPADTEKINRLLHELPQGQNMIHGDFHTNNIILQDQEPMLIDMDTLSYGHPVFELANIHIAYVGFARPDPAMVEKFIGLPAATCARFWQLFLQAYLPEGTEAAEPAIRLLSNLRYMQHLLRRNQDGETVRLLAAEVHAMLPEIDTLDYPGSRVIV